MEGQPEAHAEATIVRQDEGSEGVLARMDDIARRGAIQEALNDVPLGVRWVEPDGTIIWANSTELDMLGYAPQEYIGRPVIEFHPDLDVITDALRRLRAGETLHDYESRVLHKDGSIRYVSVSSSGYWKDGELCYIQCFTKDITRATKERWVAEAALRESEARLAFALEAGQLGSWELHLATDTAHRSVRHDQIFGYEELLPEWGYQIFIDHVVPEDRPLVDRRFREALRNHNDWHFQCRIQRADGALRWIEARGSPYRDASGTITHLMGVVADITEYKHTEQALQQARKNAERLAADLERLYGMATRLLKEDEFALVLREVMEAAVELLSADMGSLQLYDQQRNQLTLEVSAGFTESHLESFSVVSADGHSPCAMALRDLKRIVAEDVFADPAFAPFAPHAAELGIRAAQATPLMDKEGNLLGVLTTHFRKPHRPHEYELRLLDLYAQHAVHVIAIIHASEALMAADRRKDEFLAMLSHELRNPLAPISNALQLLRQEEADDVEQEALDVLDRQVGTLARLVDDLLDVSRVTTGRIELHQSRVDLNEVVRRTGDALRSLMAEYDQQFSVTLSAVPVWVHGDPTRLEQVLVNLLTNAAKYTPGGGQVTLALTSEADQAVIGVQDNGMGIEPDLLSRVFDLFSQGERSLDRRQGGLGLGLSLVRSLVEMHGGTVIALSDGPGKGSEFIVRLPIIRPPETDGALDPPVGEQQHLPKSLRILVVDDNHDAADIMVKLLRRRGYQVETAYDGPTVLQTALDFRPDVLLLDIGLPRMDGYEVARRIRQEEALRNVILVAMTGYGQPDDIRRSREAGFDHHLVKPADPATLHRILESAGESQMS